MLCSVLHNAPELLEVNMGEMQHSPGGAGNNSSAQSHLGKELQQDSNNGSNDGNSTDDLPDDRPPDNSSNSINLESVKIEPGQPTSAGQQREPTPSTSMHSELFILIFIFF